MLYRLLIPAALACSMPVSAAPRVVDLSAKTTLVDFEYRWPAAAAAIPRLDARLRADARTRRQSATNTARADRDARRGDGFPFHPHDFAKAWSVAGEAGGLLSLRDDFSSFTGGAHGMSGFEAILWDRKANRDIAVMSLFRDPAAARALLTRAFCPALDAARAEKRGAPVVKSADKTDDWLTGCPDLMKQVLVPAEVKGGRFTAILVLIGPYEAGPYVEGRYEVRLPVTTRLKALLKPERREVF